MREHKNRIMTNFTNYLTNNIILEMRIKEIFIKLKGATYTIRPGPQIVCALIRPL